MLGKLALRNVKRSIKDYVIYIITVTLAFSLMFAFNLIAFSDDLVQLASNLENFKYAVVAVSIIVVLVIGWLINYTMRFMFEKRSKEFGTYMILGIEKQKINKLFLLENIILGIFAFLISFILGFGIAKGLSFIIMNIFEMPYQVKFSFNIMSVLLSILYFALIYVFTLWRSNKRIKNMKVYDLLYFDKMNEERVLKKKSTKGFLFIISLILGIAGLILFDKIFVNYNDPIVLIESFMALIFIIISIYGMTFTLGDFILNIVLKHRNIKYKNDNLFVARNFASKIKTMGITLGTLSLLSTFTLVALNMSTVLKDSYDNNMERTIPYDIIIDTIYSDTENFNYSEEVVNYKNYVKEHYTILGDLEYNIYTKNSTEIKDIIGDLGVTGSVEEDSYIKLSDYNKLLEMLGKEKIELKNDEYFVHGNQDIYNGLEQVKENNIQLKINGYDLRLKDVSSTNYISGWSRGNAYLIVVPDEIVDGLDILNKMYVVDTMEETTEQFYNDISRDVKPIILTEEFEGDTIEYELNPIQVKGKFLASNRSEMTIILFSLIYIALVFIAVVGTILAIQSLSDSTKYKYRYSLLRKLGVEQRKIYKTIRKQISFNFIFPILYPMIIAIVTTFSINRVFGAFTSGRYTFISSLIFSCIIFFIVYFIYYIATYLGFKKNIKEN